MELAMIVTLVIVLLGLAYGVYQAVTDARESKINTDELLQRLDQLNAGAVQKLSDNRDVVTHAERLYANPDGQPGVSRVDVTVQKAVDAIVQLSGMIAAMAPNVQAAQALHALGQDVQTPGPPPATEGGQFKAQPLVELDPLDVSNIMRPYTEPLGGADADDTPTVVSE